MTERGHHDAEGAETRLSGFLAAYEPAVAGLAAGVRRRARALVRGGYELVYDNYNGLVVGYSPTEKSSRAVLSITVYPRWVRLFFLQGVDLPDPAGILSGDGSQVRSVIVKKPEALDAAPIVALVREAVARAEPPFTGDGPPTLLIKGVAEQRRPRRPG